jgi:hypothetical protein
LAYVPGGSGSVLRIILVVKFAYNLSEDLVSLSSVPSLSIAFIYSRYSLPCRLLPVAGYLSQFCKSSRGSLGFCRSEHIHKYSVLVCDYCIDLTNLLDPSAFLSTSQNCK